MIKEMATKMCLGFTKKDKVWLVRITLFITFISLFIFFYGCNTSMEDWENELNENIKNTIQERKVFKKFYEQGRTEHDSNLRNSLHYTNDLKNIQKRDYDRVWPSKIVIINPNNTNESYGTKTKHDTQDRFKTWFQEISDPENDINANSFKDKYMERTGFNDQKTFLNICLNDNGVWKDTNNKFSTMKSLHGSSTIVLSEHTSCYKNLNITNVSGNFVRGKLEGTAKITFKNKEIMVGNFERGILNGIMRLFRCEYGSCGAFEDQNLNLPTTLGEVAYYSNGVRQGLVWKFLMGGGYIVGNSKSQSTITGSDIGYVYPDTLTSIVGSFENDALIEGKLFDLVDIDFGLKCPVPIFAPSETALSSNVDKSEIYFYEPANQTSLGKNALQRDPFEEKYLYIATSTIPGAGRGVFLRRNVTKGEVVGFYNGVRLTGMESKVKHEDRRSPYRMDNEWAVPDQILNIPPNYRELSQYNATLGHLINHSNQPNAWFSMIDHPRFGKIRSIEMTKDATAGDELFCDYGFIEQYIHSENTVRSIYKMGKWWTNKSDEEYHKYLKEHIKFVRNKVHSIKPYLDMLRNWVQ